MASMAPLLDMCLLLIVYVQDMSIAVEFVSQSRTQ